MDMNTHEDKPLLAGHASTRQNQKGYRLRMSAIAATIMIYFVTSALGVFSLLTPHDNPPCEFIPTQTYLIVFTCASLSVACGLLAGILIYVCAFAQTPQTTKTVHYIAFAAGLATSSGLITFSIVVAVNGCITVGVSPLFAIHTPIPVVLITSFIVAKCIE